MNVVERAKAPTPKFFKVLRTIGLALLAVSGSIVAAPVALPAVVVTVALYAHNRRNGTPRRRRKCN